jgi:hypothetical protein
LIKRIALLLLVLMPLSAPALAADPGNGVIEGRLLNGTSGLSVPNYELTLKTYLNDIEVALGTTETDAGGGFVFSGLSTAPDYSYNITLVYQEAEYNTEWTVFSPGETTKSVDVIVYDVTTSDEAIEVELSHTIIYIDRDGLLVKEFYLFTNDTDLTYIGFKPDADSGTRRTLRFYLPDGVGEIQPAGDLMSCCIYRSNSGFVDSMPVIPGTRDISYSYRVSYDSGEYLLSRKVDYPVADYYLMVQGEGVVITSDRLTREEPLEMGGTMFSYFSASALAPGETLVAAISGLAQVGDQNAVTWVTLAVAVMVVGAVSGYLLMRKKRPQPVGQEADLDRQRQRLLVELARLDDDFEAGKIAEDNYRRRRQVVKAGLIELMPR